MMMQNIIRAPDEFVILTTIFYNVIRHKPVLTFHKLKGAFRFSNPAFSKEKRPYAINIDKRCMNAGFRRACFFDKNSYLACYPRGAERRAKNRNAGTNRLL